VIDRLVPDAERVQVVRGRPSSLDADRAVLDAVTDQVAATGVPAVRAWTPHRQVAFGRRDTRADDYELACQRAEARGYPPIERSVGGRAVAYTGSTVAFAAVIPTTEADSRQGLDARYEAATTGVVGALRSLGVPARRGEPDASFCPGAHSVQAHGKISGIAQRVRRDAAVVSGIVVVDAHEELAAVLDAVYGALDVPFDPTSVGSVARAGAPTPPDRVVDALYDSFCGEFRRASIDAASLLDSDV